MDDTPEEPLATSRLVVADTCSYLDIARAPVRDQYVADRRSVEVVADLASSSPADLVLVVLDVVATEFNKNVDGTIQHVDETLRSIDNEVRNMQAKLARMQRRCDISVTTAPSVLRPDDNWPAGVAANAIDLCRRVYGLAVPVATDADVELAYDRVRHGRAPAEKGVASMTDSVICEAALRLARGRPPGTTVLLTSNDSDFRRAAALHPDLRSQFDEAGLVDAGSWADVASFATAHRTE